MTGLRRPESRSSRAQGRRRSFCLLSFYALLGPRWDLTSKFVADGANATTDDEIGHDVFPYGDDERDHVGDELADVDAERVQLLRHAREADEVARALD